MTDKSTGPSRAGILLLAALPLLAGQSCLPDPSGGTNNECRVPANGDELVDRVLELINEERTSRGLRPVVLNPVLGRMAEDYCCEMIEYGFFGHVNPYVGVQDAAVQLEERAADAGYVDYWSIGENLAEGQTTPEQVMGDWMGSTMGHRENILHASWCEVGIGVRSGGAYGYHWVQEFGQSPSCEPVMAANASPGG